MGPKGGIFRREALDRLSSPDGLGAFIRITSPRDWMGAAILGALSLGILVWVLLGSLRVTVDGQGVLLRPGSVVLVGGGAAGGAMLSSLDEPQLVQRIRQLEDQIAVEEEQAEATGTMYGREVDLQWENIERQLERTQERIERLEALKADHQRASASARAKREEALKQREVEARAVVDALEGDFGKLEKLRQQGALSERDYITARQSLVTARTVLDDVRAARDALAIEAAGTGLEQQEIQEQIDQLLASQEALEVKKVALERERFQTTSDTSNALEALRRQLADARLELSTRRLEDDDTEVPEQEAPRADELVAVVFMDAAKAKRVQPGMELHVSPDSVEKERYGSVLGTVREVSTWPVTPAHAETLLNNAQLAQGLAGTGRSVLLVAALETDGQTASGYAWTTSTGPRSSLSPGMTLEARVTVERRAPITYLLPFLRELVGAS